VCDGLAGLIVLLWVVVVTPTVRGADCVETKRSEDGSGNECASATWIWIWTRSAANEIEIGKEVIGSARRTGFESASVASSTSTGIC
jgi:hypothetical protein